MRQAPKDNPEEYAVSAKDIEEAYQKCLLSLSDLFAKKFGYPEGLVEKVKQIYL